MNNYRYLSYLTCLTLIAWIAGTANAYVAEDPKPGTKPFYCCRAAKLIGKPVVNTAEKSVGKLRNVNCDSKAGTLIAGLIEVEKVETPETDDTDLVIPWKEFSVDTNGKITVTVPAAPTGRIDVPLFVGTDETAGLPVTAFADVKIYNQANEHIGQINDVVLRCADGRIVAVVMTTGGVYGTGAEKYLVPFAMFRVDGADKESLKVKSRLMKEQLQSGPKLVADSEYETKPEYFEKLAKHYGVPAL